LHAEIKKLSDTDPIIVGFEGVDDAIQNHAPHIIVLDILRGKPAEGDTPGLGAYEYIWDKRFCPLVFYTAVPEQLDEGDERLKHPFVAVVKKGSGSEDTVIQHHACPN